MMEQREPDIGKQLKGLWRRKWLILLTTVVAGGTALAFAPERPPLYDATATIMIESRADPLAMLPQALAVTGPSVLSRDMGTQILVIRSRGVLERAVRQVEPQAETDPEYLSSRVGTLRKSLKVRTRKRRKRQPDVFGIEVQTGTREQLGIKADAPGYYPLAVEYGYHRVDGTWIAPRSYLRAAIDATRARVIFMVKDSIRRLVESEARLLNAGGGTK